MSSEYELIVGCPKVANEDGRRFERRWLLVDEQFAWDRGRYADKLSGVQISISFGNMVLRAPGMLRLDLPMDVIEDDDSVWREARVDEQMLKVVDEGDLASVWFSNVVGCPCRLVKVHPDEPTPQFQT
ncbi:MOSC N-terminal beta barrel domain-containing protein [Orrella daihaiensis]|uniref:MOSC N-terminal beta barrel domain-containing protein n=1 Tax=Orrella daihaiensis TaxID=2782176 RepID=A0ABY4AN31_9BURK|nr:MOSC N-terminal beta barrel domain-containing protein [Orrella daihaiensis]UOD50795.1 MOSC N-terminal beta barrel domain-containing protein [Orrella daihaiensis]